MKSMFYHLKVTQWLATQYTQVITRRRINYWVVQEMHHADFTNKVIPIHYDNNGML